MADPVVAANVRGYFPEFSATTTVSDTQISNAIEEAYLFIFGANYGVFQNKIILYLSAHYLAYMLQTAAGDFLSTGPANSKSVGEVSVGFDTSESGSKGAMFQNLMATEYGKRAFQFMNKAKNTYFPYAIRSI